MSSVTLRDFWHSPSQLNRFSGLLLLGSILILLVSVAVWMANSQYSLLSESLWSPWEEGLDMSQPPRFMRQS